jgi:hypothetical protein
VEAQATWRVILENRHLVTKRENLRLQGGTGSKTRGYQGEKGDDKRAHRGSHHDLTNDRNLCVFRSDGVFGNHNAQALMRHSRASTTLDLYQQFVPESQLRVVEKLSTLRRVQRVQ